MTETETVRYGAHSIIMIVWPVNMKKKIYSLCWWLHIICEIDWFPISYNIYLKACFNLHFYFFKQDHHILHNILFQAEFLHPMLPSFRFH